MSFCVFFSALASGIKFDITKCVAFPKNTSFVRGKFQEMGRGWKLERNLSEAQSVYEK